MAEKYPGNTGKASNSGMNIQFEFDLKTNNITNLSLHSKSENDYKNAHGSMPDIQEGELVIRDLGYISIGLLDQISKVKAFYLNRIKPQTIIFEKVNGKYIRLSLRSIIKKLRDSGAPYIERELYIGDKKYLPCRIIFILVPDDKIKGRKKRQLAKSQRRGCKADPKVLEAIELNIFITNTSKEQVPSHEIYNVYRLRWQIELIFKAWKQASEINSLKKAKGHRIEAIIYAQLLWIITNWGIISTFIHYFFRLKGKLLSIFKCYKTLLLQKPEIRKALYSNTKLMKNLQQIVEDISEGHFREKRKGHLSSTQIIFAFLDK